MQRPILLTGTTGQVGGELLPMLSRLGPVIAPTRAELDLTDQAAIRDLVRQVQPRWIVNPAAYTAVDKAESDSEVAYALNRDAVRVLGEEGLRAGAPVLHFSTDYVFSGTGTTPWKEDDPTGPLGVYGASKLAGELALAETGVPHLIFRTSWIYGSTGKNFLRTILGMAATRPEMRIVSDQHGAPTWSRDLARMTMHVIELLEANAGVATPLEAARQVSGVYHAAAAGETTWFGFATEFLSTAKAADPTQAYADLVPVATAEWPTPARRPENSRLDCRKLEQVLGFGFPKWQQSTAEVVAEVLEAPRSR